MKKKYCLLMFVAFCTAAAAQKNNYAVSLIPDSLQKDADVVIRDERIKLAIKDKNTARYEVHRVVTIMNERAKGLLNFQQYSDKFHVLDDAEIIQYDQSGNKKNSWSKKEMNSGKYTDDLVPEGKITYFVVSAAAYPLTVEFNYSIRFKGILGLPGYNLQYAWQAVEHSLFEVEVPADLGIRYKLLNTDRQPVVSTGSTNRYTWELKNLTAFKLEKHSGPSHAYLPMVKLAPNKFQLDEYDGDMTSWKNYGLWINDLYAKVSGLSEQKKQFYRDMVKGASTNREKAAILYNYMQNNMRYVSIQLGIGGWRPFPAGFVEEKKYGDCKALSNYLKSTLDAVGIPSNLIVIYRDYEPRYVDEQFPMNDFNHVILCIPQAKDSIWLECTSTTLPFAELDETTLNRKAIIITENGGVVVNTPASNYNKNIENVYTVIEVDEEGAAKVNTVYSLSGEDRDKLLMRFHDMKEDEKRRFFISEKAWKHPDQLEIVNSKNKDNPYRFQAKMEYEKIYTFKAGTNYFFEPRLYPIFGEEIVEQEKRQRDYYFTYPYQSSDTTIYKFPAGYTLETIPKNKSVEFPFALYKSYYKWDAVFNTCTAITLLQIKERVVTAAEYQKLIEFKKLVAADMNEKIVIKKN